MVDPKTSCVLQWTQLGRSLFSKTRLSEKLHDSRALFVGGQNIPTHIV